MGFQPFRQAIKAFRKGLPVKRILFKEAVFVVKFLEVG